MRRLTRQCASVRPQARSRLGESRWEELGSVRDSQAHRPAATMVTAWACSTQPTFVFLVVVDVLSLRGKRRCLHAYLWRRFLLEW